MTFDPTPVQQSRSARAREVAGTVAVAAAAIDRDGDIPTGLLQAVSEASVKEVFAHDAVTAALVVEELAVASAGLATAVGLQAAGAGEGAAFTEAITVLAGLRGAEGALALAARAAGAAAGRARLVMSAVAVGVGRSAVTHALAAMKENGVKAGGDERTPHWTLADAATEVDAARLLTLSAAQAMDAGSDASVAIALAKSFASAAAERAVEAAIRVVGPDGYQAGSLLERLTRDARTITLVLDTLEQSRATAARGILRAP